MSDTYLSAQNLSKSFERKKIFSGLDFEFPGSGIYGISGKNGAGKSTLSLMLAGVLPPSGGAIVRSIKGRLIEPELFYKYIGFSSPHLVLYEELSPEENLEYFSRVSGRKADNDKSEQLLDVFEISKRKNDPLRCLSSGLKQRVRILLALAFDPAVLILDEPVSNLDISGKETLYRTLAEYSKSVLVIIASNEKSDLEICQSTIVLDEYNS